MTEQKLTYKLKQNWLKYLAAVLTTVWIVVLLFPLYWLLVSSTKDAAEAMRNPPTLMVVLPKDYTVYLDTTDVNDYDEDDFKYESLVLEWMLSSRNLTINLNSISVARVENGKVISVSKLKYSTYKDVEEEIFVGSVAESLIQNWRNLNSKKYQTMLSVMEKDGYETGLNQTPKFMDSEHIRDISAYYANVMDERNQTITDSERITTIRGKLTGISYKNNFIGMFNNYVTAWKNPNGNFLFIRHMANSTFIAVVAVLLQFVFSACVAYGLSFLVNKKASKILLMFFVVTIMLPGIVEQIPLYTTLVRLNLDNYWGILLPGATSVTYIVLFKGFFGQLPKELREAAKLDGAGEFYIYFHVAVPLSAPVFGAVGIMTFLGQWNNFFWPNMLLSDEKLYTFPMIIQRAMGETGGGMRNYSISLAMSVIATIPTFFMFAFMQKQMRAGLVLGSIKG